MEKSNQPNNSIGKKQIISNFSIAENNIIL